MPTDIKLKNSVTATNAPTSLQQGEVAINITDKKVWVGNAATTPVLLLGSGADGTFTNLSVTGVATFGAGTVSAPSITTTGDTNTGIFFPAADTIAFTEGGAESMRIISDGNVGIGTTSTAFKLDVVVTGTGAQNIISARTTGGGGQGLLLGVDTTNTVTTIRNNTGSTYGMAFYSGGGSTEHMRINSSGNVGIGTSSPAARLEVHVAGVAGKFVATNGNANQLGFSNAADGAYHFLMGAPGIDALQFGTSNGTERMRIDSSGSLLVGTTNTTPAQSNAIGFSAGSGGITEVSASSTTPFYVNRAGNDGGLVSLRQAGTQEGDISVSGTTVSYNGGHLSRWSQLPDGSKDESIVKGTVMSNLDDMCVWEKEGVVADNEQLNKMKVSDVEADTNVAGVFVNWTIDEDYGVDDMNVAMTGDMIIRIADGVVVQKGDLLMSAGDGTAKPQGDDIVRSKTIAKVTSNYVTCTYADGSYCVPCVLMAC